MSNFNIVLHRPQIPANTGNIIRACANTASTLHLIHPLGFQLDDKKLRRAGLDYHEWVNVQEYDSIEKFLALVSPKRLFAFTTRGCQRFSDVSYQIGDALLFGSETTGLPDQLLTTFNDEDRLYLPMAPNSRCLNLSNTVAIVLYEAWRQIGYHGAVAR